MEKMREEFENWAASIGFTLKPSAWSNGDYAMGYGWQEWSAWKASRSTLCVELPNGCYGDVRLSCVVDSLEDAGVSYK